MPYLDVCAVEKSFGTPRGLTRVLGGASLSLEEGEFVAIVGYSGSGKTTLISLIAGLLAPDAGTIVLDGEAVREPGPERGIVFQQYSLLPWMTVYENVALAVDAVNPGLPGADRRRLTEEFIALVNLTPAAWKRPRQLSGGMRQRVALARTLAVDPSVLLLDEPFSAVDAQTRMVLQRDLARTLKQAGKTALLITHDLAEAVLMADRVLVMSPRPGRIIDEIRIDMPHRDDPIARRQDARLGDYAARLMQRLHVGEAAAVEPAA